MHSVLFVAFIPHDRNKIENWKAFTAYIDSHVDPAKGVSRLGENVWMLNIQVSMSPLAQLVSCADDQGLSYGILPFEREPEWLPGGSDPKTILDQKGQP